MKRAALWLMSALVLTGCGRIDTLAYDPPTTGVQWLARQPYAALKIGAQEVILVQPSSTTFVYLLGIAAACAGLYFFKIQAGQRARRWWGVGLVLWGLGALLAGTSYQAFSYEIKCAGRALCTWTSWWEIAYLLCSVASVNAMMIAVSYSSAAGRTRQRMARYAGANVVLYALVALVGVMVPVKFLISFELMLVFLAPGVVFLLALNLVQYRKYRQPLDRALAIGWLGLGFTIGAYYLYLVSGMTETLWARGVWFSENDVLHIGLIGWMAYLVFGLAKRIQDHSLDKRPAIGYR